MKVLPKVVALGGPTASGKSALARKIAQYSGGEVVNADSRQVYTHMNIGTAKDPIDRHLSDGIVLIENIPHHLYDFLDPSKQYNLASFQIDALDCIDKILGRKKLPILVGGTGLYLDAVIYNYALSSEPDSLKNRDKLRALQVEALQELLQKEDPQTFKKMTQSDQNNPHRLIRAIERSRASIPTPKRNPPLFTTLYLVLTITKPELEKRIRSRVESMMSQGLVEENRHLRKIGFTTAFSSMKSIGYQEFDAYFSGEQSLEETSELIILHTLQYAKRQMTWFRRNKDVTWVSSEEEAIRAVKEFLSD